jgi:hypothetical protein
MGSRYTLKNRLDKIMKFGSQTNLILKGRIKKKSNKKRPNSTPVNVLNPLPET